MQREACLCHPCIHAITVYHSLFRCFHMCSATNLAFGCKLCTYNITSNTIYDTQHSYCVHKMLNPALRNCSFQIINRLKRHQLQKAWPGNLKRISSPCAISLPNPLCNIEKVPTVSRYSKSSNHTFATKVPLSSKHWYTKLLGSISLSSVMNELTSVRIITCGAHKDPPPKSIETSRKSISRHRQLAEKTV